MRKSDDDNDDDDALRPAVNVVCGHVRWFKLNWVAESERIVGHGRISASNEWYAAAARQKLCSDVISTCFVRAAVALRFGGAGKWTVVHVHVHLVMCSQLYSLGT